MATLERRRCRDASASIQAASTGISLVTSVAWAGKVLLRVVGRVSRAQSVRLGDNPSAKPRVDRRHEPFRPPSTSRFHVCTPRAFRCPPLPVILVRFYRGFITCLHKFWPGLVRVCKATKHRFLRAGASCLAMPNMSWPIWLERARVRDRNSGGAHSLVDPYEGRGLWD